MTWDVKKCSETCVNWVHVLLGAFFLVVAALAFCIGCSLTAKIVVACIDFYLIAVLFVGAMRSDGHVRASDFLAKRTPFLITFICTLIAICCSFATIYQKCNIVSAAGPATVACPTKNSLSDCKITSESGPAIASREEAMYFTLVTLTTVGYGDFVPRSAPAQLLVMWELGTGFLMLITLWPLLLCRIAVFVEGEGTIYVQSEPKGKTITLNSVNVGKTPASVPLKDGENSLEVLADGKVWIQTLELKGRTVCLNIELKKP